MRAVLLNNDVYFSIEKNEKYTFEEYITLINDALMSYLEKEASSHGEEIMREAMSYSVENGGKRIRPVLTLEFCRLCGGDVEAALPQIVPVVDRIVSGMKAGGRLIYAGCGTSGRLGVLDASECPPTYGVDPGLVIGVIAGGDYALRNAVEGAEDSRESGRAAMESLALRPADVVVGLSAAGGAAFVLGALEYAGSRGCATAGITCNPDTPKSLRYAHRGAHRAGGGHRLHPHEGRHRPKADFEYAFHLRHDPDRPGAGKPDDQRAPHQHQAGGPGGPHHPPAPPLLPGGGPGGAGARRERRGPGAGPVGELTALWTAI